MMKYRNLCITFICFGFVLPLFASGLENQNSITAKITFQKVSHQNPWLVGEPFNRKTNMIHLGKGLFFAMTLPKQNPVFAEFENLDYSAPKLQIKSYDSESGFILMEMTEIPKGLATVSLDPKKLAKVCPTGKSRYIYLPFSKTPIKVFLLDKKESEEPEFQLKNQILCGIQFSEYLIPAEYVAYFLKHNGKAFPHPGFSFEVNLSPSEKDYYSREISKPVLVTDVVPGVGPAYNLFPGDLITEINTKSLSNIDDWDRNDRILDLILRRPNGTLRELGETVSIKIHRNFSRQTVVFDLKPYSTFEFLIPDEAKNRKPLYLIAGGFFFTELTDAYLKEFGTEYRVKSEKKLVYLADYYQKKVHPVREKIVILSRVFPLAGNLGYHEFQDLVLEKLNGIRITSLVQLKEMIQKDEKGYFAFEFSGGKFAFYTRKDLLDLEREIQSSYTIERTQNLEN
ncbi:PDZ domain-containing protein [Leptospira sp. 96542]|nr:PDZ domain-containing protein [Leptospira sp. 96542]